ncbi:MAG: universal stress protein [Tannerella sp.]|jgi:nucleotide-binding universal stress UspA family protein|nr:universal stress protein [Tannerella sp.]
MNTKNKQTVLIPVDFTDYSMRACAVGFEYAYQNNAEVVFLNAYYSSLIHSSLSYLGVKQDVTDKESVAMALKRAEEGMNCMKTDIDTQTRAGKLPSVECKYIIREGLPEDVIIAYSNDIQPAMIVMGTRGKSRKNLDLIGSVTAEIIEHTQFPLLAIPENVVFNNLNDAENVAFAVSFKQQDLTAFDRFNSLLKGYCPSIHLFNISTSHDEWNEIRLTGTREYLQKHYPELSIIFTVLDDMDLLLAIEKFVQEKSIDVIALTTYRHSMIDRIFNPSIARKMLFHTNTALLVIPSSQCVSRDVSP